jgi:GT2 family glycosyltransferase
MPGKPICIILVNYRNDSDTVACIRSIMESVITDLPFIVVVENSGSQSTLNEKLDFYSHLHVLNPGTNLGFAGGNNYGVRWAFENLCFDFLFILNNDTIVRKDTLSTLYCYALTHSEVSFFTPCIITGDTTSRIWYAGGEMNFSRMTPVITGIGNEFDAGLVEDGFTGFASGCAIFISSKIPGLGEGVFDPNFFMYDEDVDLSLSVIESGRKIAFVSKAIIWHKCQGSQKSGRQVSLNQLSPSGTNLIFYLKNTIKNRYYIIDKHFKGRTRSGYKFRVTIYWLLKSVQYTLNCRFKAAFTVIFEICKSGSR